MSLPALAQLGMLAICTPIALVLLIVAASLASRVSTILWLCWRHRDIPGPTPHILLGNFKEIMKRGGMHLAMQQWAEEYGPIFKMFFMQQMFVVTTDPDTVHQVAFKFLTRPQLPNPGSQLLPNRLKFNPNGLVFAKGAQWRMVRNAWQPAFAPGSLVGYTQPMTETAQQLVKALSNAKHSQKSETSATNGSTDNSASADSTEYVDLHELFYSMTLDVVGTCAYGVRFNTVPGADRPPVSSSGLSGVGPVLAKAVKLTFSGQTIQRGSKYGKLLVFVPSLLPIIRPIAQLFPDEAFTRFMDARRTVVDTSTALIAEWRSRAQSENGAVNGATHSADMVAHVKMASKPASFKRAGGLSGIEPGSFLGLLLDAQHKAAQNKSSQQLSDWDISGQANTFIAAGTETTASTLTFAAYYLCQHPDKLDRLLQEVDAHGRDKPTGPDDEFPYAMAVVHEVLRLRPAATAIGRVVDRPEGIQVGPYKMKHGDNIMLPIYGLHHDPKWWPRVEEFLPERWLPEGEKELGCRNMNAYMPFGAGPRQCIGFKFALQEARIALVSVYKKFTFELKPGQAPLVTAASPLLAPKDGLWVKVVPRQPHAAAAH